MKVYSILLLCSLGAGILCAQSQVAEATPQDKQQEVTTEEQIEVWATEVKTSSVRLNKDAMAIKQPDHLSDLLRPIPGVDVGGAHSLNQRITIRSMGDRDLNIAIDGASQNSYMYHHMGNLQIHADILKAVDIQVGTNSVVHGGLGGAVHFQTKDAKDLLQFGQKVGARLQTHYGDNANLGYSATGFGQLNDRFDFLVYYNAVNRDNYSVGGDRIRNSQGQTIPGTDGEVRGLEGDLDDTLVKFGYQVSPEQRLEVSFETYQDEGDYSYRPDMGLATDLAIADNLGLPLVYPTEFTRDTLTLNYEISFSGNSRIQATAYTSESELFRDESGLAAVFGGASQVTGTAKNSGLNLLGNTILEGHSSHNFTYGAQYNAYETDFRNDVNQASGETAKTAAIYIEDRIEWQNGFSLTPGVRYEQTDVTSTIISDTFDKLTTGLMLEHRVNDALTWRASGTQLFKAPEISEVFLGAGLSQVANPDLEEETGLNLEAGLDGQGVLGSVPLTAGFTLFRTEIENYIYDYAPHPEFRSWNDNIGDLTIEGFELYFGLELGDFQSLLAFDSAESEVDAFAGYAQFDGTRLDRQQGDTLSLELNYQLQEKGLQFHYDVLNVDDVDAGLVLDGATLDNSKESYTVHNISMRWSPEKLKGLALTLGIDNLFDAFYASHSSRTGVSNHPRFGELFLLDYEPGRNIKATVAFIF